MYEVGSIKTYDAVLEEFEIEGLGDTFSCCPDVKRSNCSEVSLTDTIVM